MTSPADPSSQKSALSKADSTNHRLQSQSGLRYRPILTLGRGGMADVLLAVGHGPSGFNKLSVLKTMRKELIADEELRQMFLAEARLSARLNHANVVQVYEVVDTARPCIIMEYLEGQPMSDLQQQAGERFTLPMQLKVISDSLAGLHYSHELKDYDGTLLNIVHRDVSPQNVFITYEGAVKVLDFGIAKVSTAGNQTRTGVIKGKITYMPREQMLGEEVDRRADIYAVGCMLWHAATGIKLWDGVQDGDVMRALLEGNVPRPSEVRPVDPTLEAIIMKALAPDATDRYATARDLREAIEQHLADTSAQARLTEVGALASELFAEQQTERDQLICHALTQPLSVPPPPSPDGPEGSLVDRTGSARVQELKKGLVWSVGIGSTLLALSVVLAMLAWRERGQKAVANAPPAVAQVQHQIRLAATPPKAKLFVDGKPLSGNPAVLTVPEDTRDHEITATLDGHKRYETKVRFDRDLTLEFALQPVTSASTSAQAPVDSPRAALPKASVATGKPSISPASTAKKASADCSTPYEFDDGIKVYKPQCL